MVCSEHIEEKGKSVSVEKRVESLSHRRSSHPQLKPIDIKWNKVARKISDCLIRLTVTQPERRQTTKVENIFLCVLVFIFASRFKSATTKIPFEIFIPLKAKKEWKKKKKREFQRRNIRKRIIRNSWIRFSYIWGLFAGVSLLLCLPRVVYLFLSSTEPRAAFRLSSVPFFAAFGWYKILEFVISASRRDVKYYEEFHRLSNAIFGSRNERINGNLYFLRRLTVTNLENDLFDVLIRKGKKVNESSQDRALTSYVSWEMHLIHSIVQYWSDSQYG